jgi:formimidoylglutamate deiminase
MANVHSHAFQRAMAGLAEWDAGGKDNFWSWREAMYRFAERLDPDAQLAIARFLFVEMVRLATRPSASFTICTIGPAARLMRQRARWRRRLRRRRRRAGLRSP